MSNGYPTEARYHLLVPNNPSIISKGAALVAKEMGEGTYLVHYEEPGDISNIRTFEDRIVHAAGRLHDNYPTSKMMSMKANQVTLVGVVRHLPGLGWHIEEITNRECLFDWEPGPHYEGGSPDLHDERRARDFSERIRSGRS